MPSQLFNLVTFRPSGGPVGPTPTSDGAFNPEPNPRIYLTLPDDWTMTPGVEPSLNTAIVPYTEFDKLPDLVDLSGDVEFWFHNTPGVGNADATYAKQRIVDLEATKIGKIAATSLPRPLEYKITFADAREQFTWPCGGIVSLGEVNKSPLDAGNAIDANNQLVVGARDLVKACLTAMGLDPLLAPSELDFVPVPQDIEWRANHAPAELKKLLTLYGYTLTLRSDGTYQIWQIGTGQPPTFGADQTLPVITTPLIDRRGATVIFTSAPNGTIKTETISGIGSNIDDKGWQYVVQETDGSWVELFSASYWQNVTPHDATLNDFASIDFQYRARLRDQAWRCIRLNPAIFGPATVLRSITRGSTPPTPLEVRANIATYSNGLWQNTLLLEMVNVVAIYDGQVIKTEQRLVKLQVAGSSGIGAADTEVNDFVPLSFNPLGTPDLSVRCSREVHTYDQKKKLWQPEYFEVAFKQGTNQIVKLAADALALVRAGPLPTIVRKPEWVLHVDDANEINRADLESKAQQIAPRFIRNSGSTTLLLAARGFATAELNGVVSEVKISQSGKLTTAKTNTWWLPGGENYVTAAELDKGDKTEKFPQQQATAATKTAAGQSGAVQPAVPILPASSPVASRTRVKFYLDSPAAGSGRYNAYAVAGLSIADASTDQAQPDGQIKTTTLVLATDLAEDGRARAFGHARPAGYYYGDLVSRQGGKPAEIEFDSERCGADTNHPVNLGIIDPANVTSDTVSAELIDQKELFEKRLSRIGYDPSAGTPTLYMFWRVYHYLCGRLIDVSAETKVAVVQTEPCS